MFADLDMQRVIQKELRERGLENVDQALQAIVREYLADKKQKVQHARSPVMQWWLECLRRGSIVERDGFGSIVGKGGWPETIVGNNLHYSYSSWCDAHNLVAVQYRAFITIYMKPWLGPRRQVRDASVDARDWVRDLLPLEQARELFNERFKTNHDFAPRQPQAPKVSRTPPELVAPDPVLPKVKVKPSVEGLVELLKTRGPLSADALMEALGLEYRGDLMDLLNNAESAGTVITAERVKDAGGNYTSHMYRLDEAGQ